MKTTISARSQSANVAPPKRHFYFFIGTVAELIKIMPVMHRLQDRAVPFSIIASGQNSLENEPLFTIAGLPEIELYLTKKPVKKSVLGLLAWFVTTFFRGMGPLRKTLKTKQRNGILVVHGDTLSTVMGAVMGKLNGLEVAHVEAGLRSHNFFQPFPEELDRYIAAFFADYHFAPSEEAVYNLAARRGRKINTGYNTNIDSLAFVSTMHPPVETLERVADEKFFIFIMHRQENLLNSTVVRSVVAEALRAADTMKCVFIAHEPTIEALKGLNLLSDVRSHPNVVFSHRLPYPEFMALLRASEYIITDGGGNQQECYYLGKPCLLLRNLTEGKEGLDGNVVISGNDPTVIRQFTENYSNFRRPLVRPNKAPSDIIVETLLA